MPEKKKTSSTRKPTVAKPPTLTERITDTSVSKNKVTWIPKKK